MSKLSTFIVRGKVEIDILIPIQAFNEDDAQEAALFQIEEQFMEEDKEMPTIYIHDAIEVPNDEEISIDNIPRFEMLSCT